MRRGSILPDGRPPGIGRKRVRGARPGRRRRTAIAGVIVASVVASLVAGCYPRYDWRDYRPDCQNTWCGFVASFPGRVSTATRDVRVGPVPLPLALHVVSVGDVTFAVGAFDLRGNAAGEARAVFENKLIGDVGASDATRGRATMRSADRDEIVADTFDVEGRRDGKPLRATARFVERRGRLVEIVVIGPADTLSTGSGRQAVETFVTSLRLD